ncbi:Uncharacterised protein [Bordetella pertussis]|nr:Uncharacterised protein [Bordetella pertussis]
MRTASRMRLARPASRPAIHSRSRRPWNGCAMAPAYTCPAVTPRVVNSIPSESNSWPW